jgi:hypothetical protein
VPPAVLLYDGSRPAFRAVADAATRCADVRAVPLSSDAAGQFLDAQFDGRPFAFVLVEDESVHAGGATVERVLERRGLGGPVAALARRAYGPLSGPVGRLVHGQEPADIDGTRPLRDAARDPADRLRDGVSVPIR